MSDYGQFHDGHFEGLWIDDTTVHVYLRTVEKKRFTVVAEGVVALGAGWLREGNIILNAAIRRANEILFHDVAEVFELENDSAGETQTTRELEKAQQKGLILLRVNPSYGATCLVLAQSVELLERKEWLARYITGKAG